MARSNSFCARPHVVLPAVPRAGEDAALESSLAQRALQVQAMLLDGVEAAVAVGEGDLLLAGLDSPDGARRDVLHPCDGHKFHAATLPTAPSSAVRSVCGDDPAVWGRSLLSGQARGTSAWPSLRDRRQRRSGRTSSSRTSVVSIRTMSPTRTRMCPSSASAGTPIRRDCAVRTKRVSTRCSSRTRCRSVRLRSSRSSSPK